MANQQIIFNFQNCKVQVVGSSFQPKIGGRKDKNLKENDLEILATTDLQPPRGNFGGFQVLLRQQRVVLNLTLRGTRGGT